MKWECFKWVQCNSHKHIHEMNMFVMTNQFAGVLSEINSANFGLFNDERL